jgi:hypothetical protein
MTITVDGSRMRPTRNAMFAISSLANRSALYRAHRAIGGGFTT